MDYKLNIYFTNEKNMTLVLKEKEFKKFLADMKESKPYWNEDKKSGFSVPIYSVMYYQFFEYTAEMKKKDDAKLAEAFQAKLASEEAALKEEQEEKKA